MENIKMRCKSEAKKIDGVKILDFTKGKIYEFVQLSEDEWETIDDYGNKEGFFNINIMFEEIK